MNELNQSIGKLLSSLPEEERIILTLYYRSEKSTIEIAGLLGVPEAVISRMVQSSKTRLLHLLTGEN